MRKGLLVVATALVAGSAISTSALADQVDMRFIGAGPSRVVNTEIWAGSARVYNGALRVGALQHQFSDRGTSSMTQLNNATASTLDGMVLGTFCTDVLESVDSRWRRYEMIDAKNAPATNGPIVSPMGLARSERLAQLYNFAQTGPNPLLNTFGGWNNMNTSTATAADAANSDMAAAFQMLVWEIVFDNPDSANFASTGMMRFSNMSASVMNYFLNFRDAALSYSTTLPGFSAISRGGSQDQLIIIPLPPAALAGIGMLVGLAGVRYARRRKLARA